MTKGKHTPGPWTLEFEEGENRAPVIYGANSRIPATATLGLPIETVIANAHLIAASPALYEALEALAFEVTVSAAGPRAKAIIENPDSQIGGALAKARAALSLARGEKP